jgi:hypothetical protein
MLSGCDVTKRRLRSNFNRAGPLRRQHGLKLTPNGPDPVGCAVRRLQGHATEAAGSTPFVQEFGFSLAAPILPPLWVYKALPPHQSRPRAHRPRLGLRNQTRRLPPHGCGRRMIACASTRRLRRSKPARGCWRRALKRRNDCARPCAVAFGRVLECHSEPHFWLKIAALSIMRCHRSRRARSTEKALPTYTSEMILSISAQHDRHPHRRVW